MKNLEFILKSVHTYCSSGYCSVVYYMYTAFSVAVRVATCLFLQITLDNPSTKTLKYRALLRGEHASKFIIVGSPETITVRSTWHVEYRFTDAMQYIGRVKYHGQFYVWHLSQKMVPLPQFTWLEIHSSLWIASSWDTYSVYSVLYSSCWSSVMQKTGPHPNVEPKKRIWAASLVKPLWLWLGPSTIITKVHMHAKHAPTSTVKQYTDQPF